MRGTLPRGNGSSNNVPAAGANSITEVDNAGGLSAAPVEAKESASLLTASIVFGVANGEPIFRYGDWFSAIMVRLYPRVHVKPHSLHSKSFTMAKSIVGEQLTGYDRKTIRKYLIQPESTPAYGPRPAKPSKLDAFKPYLDERLKAGVWTGAVLKGGNRARKAQTSVGV